jgi:uncharacterized membrane-anchored protein
VVAYFPGFQFDKDGSQWYWVASLTTDTIYTVFGGWLCAAIALGDRRGAWGLVFLGELMGVVSTVYLWNAVPHFYSFILLIVYPPAVLMGAGYRKADVEA